MQATTNPVSVSVSRTRRAKRETTAASRPLNPLASLDRLIERVIGCDMKLIYGMLVPMLVVVGCTVAFMQSPTYWLLGATMAVEFLCLALVITKILAILNEPEEDQLSA